MPSRSPAIFWLLLAATLSVDAVAYAWAKSEADYSYAYIAFSGLLLGQISVVCIWSALSPAATVWTRINPFLVVIVASLVWGLFGSDVFDGRVEFDEWAQRFSLAAVHQALHAALLLASLWLLKRTPFWKRRSGLPAEWQFSVADLLVVMTIVAVLVAGVQFTDIFDGGDAWFNASFIASSVVVALASVVLWSLSIPWMLRLGAVIGVALGLSAVAVVARPPFLVFVVLVGSHLLIQAVVLSAWLGIGPILPPRPEVVDDGG